MAINRDKLSASAIKHLQAGKYDRAIADLQRLVEDDPKDVRTLLKLGDTWVKTGQRADAIGSYQAVADIYSEQGFFLKAVAVFKQMLRVDTNLPNVHLQLAEMYQQLGLHSDCMQHFQQVAVFYEREGDLEKTLDVLKRMVDLDPDNLPSRIKLAELFAQQGHNDKAIEEFRSAADYLKEHERFDDYVRVAERLVYFDPSAIQATRELAQIYLTRGEAKLALGKLQTCFKADPRNLETLSLIAESFLAMEQIPKTISVYKEMARIHESTGNQSEAQSGWHKVLELVPDDAEAQQALGMVGVSSAAAEAPVPVAAPAPAAPAADPEEEQLERLLTETDVYVKYGLRDKALEHLIKITALRPENIDAHDKMRDLYQQMGNRAGLVDRLRVLVDLGQRLGDSRLAGWQRDFELLAGAGPAPPDDDGLLDLVEEESSDLLLDPALGDESVVDSQRRPALPPDESLAYEEAIADDAILEDGGAVVLEEASIIEEAPLDASAPPSLSYADAELDEFDELDELEDLPTGPAPLVGIGSEAEFHSGEEQTELLGDGYGALDGLGDALGAELAAAAAAGIEKLSGLDEGAEEFAMPPDSLADGLGDGESFFNEAAFGAPGDGALGDKGAGPVAGQEGFASTEIMSLSPEEMAEIQAMAQPSSLGPTPEPLDQVASGQLLSGHDGAERDVDDFNDATMVLSLDASLEEMESRHGESLHESAAPGTGEQGLGESADPKSGLGPGLGADASAFEDGSDFLGPEEEAEIAEEMAAIAASMSGDALSDEGLSGEGLSGEGLSDEGLSDDALADDAVLGGDYRDATDAVLGPATLQDDGPLLEAGAELILPDEEADPAAQAGGAFVPAGALLDDGDLDSQPLGELPEAFADLDDLSAEDLTVPSLGLEADLPGAPLATADSAAGDPFAADLAAAAATHGALDGFAHGGSSGDSFADDEFGDDAETTDPKVKAAPQLTLEDQALPSHDESSQAAASGDPVLSGAPADEPPRKPKLGVSESAYGFEDDPAGAFFADELEEAEFFLSTELIDEAREILLEIQEDVEESPRVAWMLARCQAIENEEPEPPAPWAEKVLEGVEEEVGSLFDHIAEPVADGQVSVDEVLAQFKKGVAEQVDESDAETHYSLGIAYREMGLIDDAIAEFEIAARAPGKSADAKHLVGLCFLDREDYSGALDQFSAALAMPDLPAVQQGANEYQVGICQEALHDPGAALAAFRRALEHGAGQQDIKKRIAALADRVGTGAVGSSSVGAGETSAANGSNGFKSPNNDVSNDAPPRKKNIDYL